MTFSSSFHTVWTCACLQEVGRVLPINYLCFDQDKGEGEIGFHVADTDPPIELLDGYTVRGYVIGYKYKEIKNELRNAN